MGSDSLPEPGEHQAIKDSGGTQEVGSGGAGAERGGGGDVGSGTVGLEATTDQVVTAGNGGAGVEENGGSLDEIEEDPVWRTQIDEGETRVEQNGDSLADEVEEDPDGKFDMSEEMGDEEHDFSVGDFVWGKIKSHPWWPAQIFDASDASEYAAKLKPKDRQLLVAYFGDGTFAWCHPSQLKPFEENFGEMSKQGSSKAFVTAVQQAVDEIGRLVKLKMSCGCVEKVFLSGLGQPLAINAGVKEGVLVPEAKVENFLAHLADPAELVSELKHAAQDMSMASELELAVVKSWLSAFYCLKGGYQLPEFCEPQQILGLEDDWWRAVDVPVQGPFEDWVSSPIGIKTFRTNQPFSQCSHQILEDRQYQRRKQKSMADLMGGEDDILAKSKNGGIMATEEEVSGEKKQNGSESSDDEGSLIAELDKRRAILSRSPRNRVKRILSVESDCSDSKGESTKGRLSRRRKKNLSIDIDGNDGNAKEESGVQGDMKEHIEHRSFSRERKKSKYLSPPFTNLSTLRRKQEMEFEYLKLADEAQIGSPRMLNGCPETVKKKPSEEVDVGNEVSGGAKPKPPAKDEEKKIDPTKANASTSLVLSEVRSAALNPCHDIKGKSFDIFWDFISIFRDSVYRNGFNYTVYKHLQPQSSRKRKNSESETDETLPNSESGKKKIRRIEETKPDEPPPEQKSKIATGAPDLKKRRKRTDDVVSPASLFVTFGPGSSLPTKADLIKIYSKFGDLNESETEMFYNNFCARVSFVKISDAEEAFNHSQNDSPFGASNVNFRLHNLSAAAKIRDLSEISNSPAAMSRGKAKIQPVASQKPVASEVSQVDFIKQKLKKMSSMLENSDGKMSRDTKSKLGSEIKELLESVSTMAEGSA